MAKDVKTARPQVKRNGEVWHDGKLVGSVRRDLAVCYAAYSPGNQYIGFARTRKGAADALAVRFGTLVMESVADGLVPGGEA